jgi:hypothetical protein
MPVNVGQRVDLCHLQAQRIKLGFGRCDLAVARLKIAEFSECGFHSYALIIDFAC